MHPLAFTDSAVVDWPCPCPSRWSALDTQRAEACPIHSPISRSHLTYTYVLVGVEGLLPYPTIARPDIYLNTYTTILSSYHNHRRRHNCPIMAAFIKYGLLNPVITGPLLYILTKGPEQYQEPILHALGPYLSAKLLPGAITALKWLFALGIIRPVHEFLNELANNNFRWKAEVYDWPNEIAVVTGGANGFGRLMSEGLASHGVNVIALDISDSLPKEMQANKKIHYYKCDVTSAEAVNATADAIRAEHGDPSVLINNAGIAISGHILEQTPDKIRRVFDVNTISHYFTVNAFLPAMISKHKGHIVTIASMASFLSGPVSFDTH